MNFFVDANVPAYAAAGEQPYGEACGALIGAIARKARGKTSVVVIAEILHLELSGRAGATAGLARGTIDVFAPVLPVTEEVVGEALQIDVAGLGANDRIHVATCRLNGIEVIVSADAGFDAVPGLERVDPLDEERLAALLAA